MNKSLYGLPVCVCGCGLVYLCVYVCVCVCVCVCMRACVLCAYVFVLEVMKKTLKRCSVFAYILSGISLCCWFCIYFRRPYCFCIVRFGLALVGSVNMVLNTHIKP